MTDAALLLVLVLWLAGAGVTLAYVYELRLVVAGLRAEWKRLAAQQPDRVWELGRRPWVAAGDPKAAAADAPGRDGGTGG